MDDDKIIELYFSRSETAISQTSLKYSGMCRRIAFNILHNNEDSEECVNDTWLKAWDSIPPTRPDCLSAFLSKITRNLSLNRWKKKKRQTEAQICLEELEECIPDKHGEPSEDFVVTDTLNSFLESIEPDTRKIFVQRYWYMCPVKEIARGLSMGQSAVKMRLMRTRTELKAYLEKEGIEI